VVGGMRWVARVAAGHLLHHKLGPFESRCTRARPVVGGQHERRMKSLDLGCNEIGAVGCNEINCNETAL
jgi:hypothetical protein